MSIIVILPFSLQSLSTVVIIDLYLDLVKLHVAFLFSYLLPFMVNKDEYTPCFRKKTSTHITGYKLRNSCLILIIFDTKIPHII